VRVEEHKIRALLAAGESNKSIMRQLPVGKGRVRRLRREMGLPAHRTEPVTPTHCLHGHRLADHAGRTTEGWMFCQGCAGPYAAVDGEAFAARHTGHVVTWRSDGHRQCITCLRGDHDLDDVVVLRTVGGDRPERLTPAARERAALELRSRRISAGRAAELLGCTARTVYRIYARQRIDFQVAA
jgi:DNA-binding CsgD family transcriptional regulator